MHDFEPAVRATNDVCILWREARSLLEAEPRLNRHFILEHPGDVLNQLQEVRRALEAAQATLVRAQWPSSDDYRAAAGGRK
jgi:hypothetical protein